MIKHLLKLVWNRKRINFLITVEIFISFIVLFLVMLIAVYFGDNYRRPLGFNYEHVWNVKIEASSESDAAGTVELLMRTVKEFDEVESLATAKYTPYGNSHSRSGINDKGNIIMFDINDVSDDYNQAMGLTITRGRWFGKEDDGAQYRPLLINEWLAHEVFGDADPIGKPLRSPGDTNDAGYRVNESRPGRIVGVITDFRQEGEYSGLGGYVIERQDFGEEMRYPPGNLMIKVRPGVTAAFEEKLIKRLQAIAKDWSFEIERVSEMRESANQIRLAPLVAGALVAGFLMIMVALGLTGVLWQNVTQRTKEIGLRRAKGATARRIHRQILAELLIIATAGLGAGVAVVAQFPLLDLIGFISVEVYTMSIVISLAVIYALTIVCGLYPSWMATKVQPAEALHYE